MLSALKKAVAWTLMAAAVIFIIGTLQVGGPVGWFSGMGLLGIVMGCLLTMIIVFPLSLILFAIRARRRR